MKFKFTIRGLLVITTLVAAAIAFGVRMAQINPPSLVMVVTFYGLIYLVFFAVFFLPHYRREFKTFRKRWAELQVYRNQLEMKSRPAGESDGERNVANAKADELPTNP